MSLRSFQTATSSTLHPETSTQRGSPLSVLVADKEPSLIDLPKWLAMTLARVENGEDLSQEMCGILIKWRTDALMRNSKDLLVKILTRMIERGSVEGLVKALISLPSEKMATFYASLSEDELRVWTSQPAALSGGSLFYKLVMAVFDAREPMRHVQVCTLFHPFGSFAPFARLFFASRSPNYSLPSHLPSSKFTERIDAFLQCIQELYTDRPVDSDVVPAARHLCWLLEATAIFIKRGTNVESHQFVLSVVRHISFYANHGANFAASSGHSSSTHSAGLSYHALPLDAAGITPHFVAQPTAEKHPASAYLLVAIYLAKHSKLASETMLDHGLVRLLERLFDEPPMTIHSETDLPVSGISRQVMYRLSHELLVQISRHVDLRDCTIKQELRDEIVAASRAASARYFDIQWWEVIYDDYSNTRLKELLRGDSSCCDNIRDISAASVTSKHLSGGTSVALLETDEGYGLAR